MELEVLGYCQKMGRECYGKTELPLLFDISRKLHDVRNIKEDLDAILANIAQYLNAERVILTILNRENSSIFIERGFGITDEAKARGVYKVGEGVIGRVVKCGEPVVIPKILKDNTFLNRTKSKLMTPDRRHISFICVPVRADNEITGTLSVDIVYNEREQFNETVRILIIIGSMIAQLVRARQDRLEELTPRIKRQICTRQHGR